MSLYLQVETIKEYRVFIHRRSRKTYSIDNDILVKQIDIMPKASYATFDDDNTVGDVVIVREKDYVESMENDMNSFSKMFVPLAKEGFGITL